MEPVYKFSLPEREALIKHLEREGVKVMQAKAPTYASNEWANQNFWEEAAMKEPPETPAQNCLTHHTKHIRTTSKFIAQNGQNWVDTEPITGRFIDAVNYPGIEWTILIEQGTIPLPDSFKPILEQMRKKPRSRCYYCGSRNVDYLPPYDAVECRECKKKTTREALEDFEYVEPGLLKGRTNGFFYRANRDGSFTRIEDAQHE